MATVPKTIPTGKPCWSREASVGDYGGSQDKVPSSTEGTVPYAWFVYRNLAAQRGTAYTGQIGGTLVHAENLALARLMSWVWFRQPEKFRANCLPGSADEALPYWSKVLSVPTKLADAPWQVRQRAAAHYRAVTAIDLPSIQAAVSQLLGDAYVDATFQIGSDLTTPPSLTFWDAETAGPASYSLGGGAWISERSHLFVQVQRPSGMTDGDLAQLLNVQLFQLLDRILPAYCTFAWGIGGGFLLDISQLDFTGLTPS